MLRYLWAAPNTALGLWFLPAACFADRGVSMVDGVVELHSPLISWLLRRWTPLPGGALALTFGHVVIGRDLEALAMTRTHERVHVRQYEAWGPLFIPAYLAASIWGLATGRGAYLGNMFEREAFRDELH